MYKLILESAHARVKYASTNADTCRPFFAGAGSQSGLNLERCCLRRSTPYSPASFCAGDLHWHAAHPPSVCVCVCVCVCGWVGGCALRAYSHTPACIAHTCTCTGRKADRQDTGRQITHEHTRNTDRPGSTECETRPRP